MNKQLIRKIAELDQELTSIMEKLEEVAIEFFGCPPEIPSNPNEWANQVGGGDFVHVGDHEGQRRFGPAWHRAYNLIYPLFFGRFSDWADQAVAAFGKERFKATEIPDPPVYGEPYGMPLLSQGTSSAVARLTRTGDTGKAGLRIIYWAAAFKNPLQFQRSIDHAAIMKIWIGQTIDISRNARRFDAPDEFVGVCRPLDELMEWVWDAFEALCDSARSEGAGSNSPRRQRRHSGEAIPKRSYTQVELDAAIREYKARRSSRFSELVDRVARGDKGATKAAQEMFGRNALVRGLGVKSPAMVTKSTVWQEIALQLQLDCKATRQGNRPRSKIGHEVALDRQAEQRGDTTFDRAIRNETIQLVRQRLPGNEAEATVGRLQLGDMTDDQARELVETLEPNGSKYSLSKRSS